MPLAFSLNRATGKDFSVTSKQNGDRAKSDTSARTEGVAGSVDISANRVDDKIAELAIRGELRASRFRSRVGCSLIVAGVVLILLGTTGNVGWNINMLGLGSELSNASPGIVCVVAGVFMILRNEPKIKL